MHDRHDLPALIEKFHETLRSQLRRASRTEAGAARVTRAPSSRAV
jgi:hypothetical protein